MKFLYCALVLPDPPKGTLLREITFQSAIVAALVIATSILTVRYVAKLGEGLSTRNPGARFLLKWTVQVFRLLAWFVTIFIVLLVLAPNSDTFLAALGSGAIAIALGAQDLIKNIAGGLVILTDRPYQVGDRVTIDDTVGEVVHIGLRSTKLRTPLGCWITVANSDLMNGQVKNDNYGVPECPVLTTLYIPTDSDVEKVTRLAYEAAWCSPFLRAANPVVVNLSDEYSETPFMKLTIKAFVFDHRYLIRMQTDITMRLKKEFERLGVLAKWKAE